jgi:endonuclease/exonuclease/phosphatase family metal-dependent hydrolase
MSPKANIKVLNKYVSVAIIFFMMLPLTILAKTKPFKVPNKCIRVMTWNIQFLGNREPLRTDKELGLMAKRIKSWDASVIALQEIQSRKRIQDLVKLLGKSWRVNPEAGWTPEKKHRGETCLIWNTKKVKCLKHQSHSMGYKYKNRPPFSGAFLPLNKESEPFIVISNHAYPGGNEAADTHRQWQGTFYRKLVLEMLKVDANPKSILLVGDFNGEPGASPHNTIQPESEPLKLHLLKKSDDGGTCVDVKEDIDHIYVTDSTMKRLCEKKSHVIRPTLYNETRKTFNQVYSDHLPVFVDIKAFNQK